MSSEFIIRASLLDVVYELDVIILLILLANRWKILLQEQEVGSGGDVVLRR
jgi:hypothetical protein